MRPITGMIILALLASAGAISIAWFNREEPTIDGYLVPEAETIVWPPASTSDAGPPSSHAEFRLTNLGDTPVTIDSVETTCGCAEPQIYPATVQPKCQTSIRVRLSDTKVVSGVRVVSVVLHTDSRTIPRNHLYIKLVDRTPPPYIVSAQGELVFLDPSPGETRRIQILTVENRDSDETPRPVCSEDLFRFELVDRKVRPNDFTPDAVYREYTYDAILLEVPKSKNPFFGQVEIDDPWDGRPIPKLNYSIKSIPPILVNPPRAVLRVGGETQGRGADEELRFTVVTKLDTDQVSISIPNVDEAPIEIREIKKVTSKLLIFRLGLKPNASAQLDQYEVQVDAGEGANTTVVPISIRR